MALRGLIALLALVALAVGARRWLDVVEVRGRSMAPTLVPGDRLLVVRARPRFGDVALATDPREPSRELVKRVARIDARGIQLRGDNPLASTDARVFGSLPAAAVSWRAVVRYWPPARFGPIPAAPSVVPVPLDEGGESACAVPDALIARDHSPDLFSPARSRPAGIRRPTSSSAGPRTSPGISRQAVAARSPRSPRPR
jgi:nickel-type superoxide dismutase maturation protease